ncbi:MAG: SAV_915 family protein [Schaalia hyovaginalis]|uniref:SAV_915 family protein n=1 Tax=Schaalia hyovaginalis TaxID=29316 RepID=UPI002A91CD97|nr:SAV_915 family protein [Schaalia hyovaginalis]MDY6214209.1 SAV_915 family protein [Schaalia hyovaginalis]
MLEEELVVPPVVYVPTAHGSARFGAEVELRQMDDGRVALLVYTALDRLYSCCGRAQPWVLYPTERLEDLARVTPYDVIFFDMEIPHAMRHRENDEGVGLSGGE